MAAGKDINIRNIGHTTLHQLQVVNKCAQWPDTLGQRVTPSMVNPLAAEDLKVSSSLYM